MSESGIIRLFDYSQHLASCAKDLGKYIMQHEWDLVMENYAESETPDFDSFYQWIKGFQYYNALVCSCALEENPLSAIRTQLESDYEELQAM